MLHPRARKTANSLKAEAVQTMGNNPHDWILQRNGSWTTNERKIQALILAAEHAKNENRVEDPALTVEEGLALITYLSGNKTPDDMLTVPTDREIAAFRATDSVLSKTAPKNQAIEMQRQMNLILAIYHTQKITVVGTIIQGTDSLTKITEDSISIEIKRGTCEEMVVNLAHEIAHIKQRRNTTNSPQSDIEWKLFVGKQLQHLHDPNIAGPHHAAYRRNILERDADLFAIQIANAIDPVRYQAAIDSQLLSD